MEPCDVAGCDGAGAELTTGVFPPFNSLDVANGLPLGSATVEDLSDLSYDVTGLEQGIPYYFRVFAVNKLGQGPAAMASPPYVIPMPQKPGAPLNFSLMVLDGTSLRASFAAPVSDGGDEIDRYQVEYVSEEFVDEVQSVRVSVTQVKTEVKTLTTDTLRAGYEEVQLAHAKL